MKNQVNINGFDLYMLAIDDWAYDDNFCDGLTVSSFAKTLVGMTLCGFKILDLELGVEMMLAANHDSIRFGIHKNPLYTYNRKENKRTA